jgi:two-component SAPR family response regulator
MKRTIGLLTNSGELIDDFSINLPNSEVTHYRTVDSIKKENHAVFAIDCEIFESTDQIQFFLSKIRKKINEIPALLIIKLNLVPEIKSDWFINDFIIYPFRKEELRTRIDRIMLDKDTGNTILQIGNLKINLTEYKIYLNNQKMELTFKEFELIRLLVENRGTVFSRKELLNRIWGMEYIGGTRTVDVHIRRLRGKLGDDFNSIIETVRNVGYRCKD